MPGNRVLAINSSSESLTFFAQGKPSIPDLTRIFSGLLMGQGKARMQEQNSAAAAAALYPPNWLWGDLLGLCIRLPC